ncbi:MAG TPA: DUF2480 family protein [Bacteroidia bacterium]|nr:DUF2480 family protein [Bacteroidia bacterium]
MSEIINKVSESGLVTIDLEDMHVPGERILFDLKGWLFEELILKEKDFREQMKIHPWEKYQDALVAVTCTADAIVPTWAYMLIATKLSPYARKIVFGNLTTLEDELFREQVSSMNPELYRNQRVVIKGCSKNEVPVSAYVSLTAFLKPLVKSIMYGEPCSTVPVYKRVEK